jgi:hypothetical protein
MTWPLLTMKQTYQLDFGGALSVDTEFAIRLAQIDADDTALFEQLAKEEEVAERDHRLAQQIESDDDYIFPTEVDRHSKSSSSLTISSNKTSHSGRPSTYIELQANALKHYSELSKDCLICLETFRLSDTPNGF